MLFLCLYSPVQWSLESHLDWHSVLWNATYPWWAPPTPKVLFTHPHPSHLPTTWPPKSRFHCGAVLKARMGKGGRDSWFWAPVCETWKPTLTLWPFHIFWVYLVLFPFTVSFSTPPPPLCPAPSFSPTPLLHPFSLHCVRCVRVNIRSCLPSSLALLPDSVSSPLASCLSSMSFLAWLYLSLKSTLLFFVVLFFFLLWHWHWIPSFFASQHFNFDT